MSLLRQSSVLSSNGDGDTIAIGIDLGSFNARIGMYDDTLQHPVVVTNRDGHRATQVVLEALEEGEGGGDDDLDIRRLQQKEAFFQKLMDLAADAAHTKDLHVVISVPNNRNEDHEWTKVFLQDKTFNARILTEAAAVCLAYEADEEGGENAEATTTTTTSAKGRTLVIDGGAQGIKATILSQTASGIWKLDQAEQSLPNVNGDSLLEPLAKFVAQQFEIKNRFPRGEVWESKKARKKIFQACQVGLKTLYINNSSVTIHVDGLYEGIDYQVAVSKPKWEHLSGKLVRETKAFLSKFDQVDRVLLSGGLYTWLTPIVKGIFGEKLQSTTNYFDPSEAIAMGCTKQANYHLEAGVLPMDCTPTLKVPMAPVSIGIGQNQTLLLEKGTPLPAMITQTVPCGGSGDEGGASNNTLELWQWEPTPKALCKLEELTESSVLLKLQMTTQGQLRVWVDGETLAF